MNFYRALRTGVVSLVVVLVLLCAAASTAVAQDQNQTIEQPEEESIENQLIDLLVRDVEYADGEFNLKVEWTGTTPETLTLTEMIQLDGSGSQSISMQTIRLYPGETTDIDISVSKRSDGTAAMILSTQQSLERGDALVIQEGEPTTRSPVPFNLAALSVIGSALIGVGVSVALVVRKKRSEERGKERIA